MARSGLSQGWRESSRTRNHKVGEDGSGLYRGERSRPSFSFSSLRPLPGPGSPSLTVWAPPPTWTCPLAGAVGLACFRGGYLSSVHRPGVWPVRSSSAWPARPLQPQPGCCPTSPPLAPSLAWCESQGSTPHGGDERARGDPHGVSAPPPPALPLMWACPPDVRRSPWAAAELGHPGRGGRRLAVRSASPSLWAVPTPASGDVLTSLTAVPSVTGRVPRSHGLVPCLQHGAGPCPPSWGT